MDFDSSSKFIASLARFLQSLCNGYVEFDKGVEVIGHIYLSVDSDTGRKIDYVLNEKVCKNDNSVTFISNSFHAQPAEKPKAIPKKSDSENRNEDSVVMDDSGRSVPNSTNVGTMGSSQDRSNKRPRSPFQRRMGVGGASGVPPSKSPRYHESGQAKSAHTDIPPSGNNNLTNSGEDYDGDGDFHGGDEDSSQNYPSNFLSQDYSNSEIDQKPVIEPDISIVKEEYMSSQQQSGSSYLGSSQPTGPGRGRAPSSSQSSSYPMMHQNSSYSPGDYSGSSIEPRDPSELTRAQQEELEMYYRKGTDQHLTFLRNMREAHAMYPFTGKRDKELFDKALAELFNRLPLISTDVERAVTIFVARVQKRLFDLRSKLKGQFKSPGPGMGGRGKGYMRQPSYPGTPQGYPYSPGYSGRSPMPMGLRGAEGIEYYQGGDEGYDYQQGASDDSRDTQHSSGGDVSQHQMGFGGEFGDSSQQGYDQAGDSAYAQDRTQGADASGAGGSGNNSGKDSGAGGGKSPPDIKYEVTPMPFIKADDFELIEIDPDEEDDL